MQIKYFLGGILCVLLAACTSTARQDLNKPIVAGMVFIPAGEFTMGSNKEDNINMWREANALNPYGFNDQLYVNERPAHKLMLPAFLIDQYEVTNAQYRNFVIATGHSVPILWPRNGYVYSNTVLRTFPLEGLRQVATNNFKLDMDVSNMSQEALLAELRKANAVRDMYPVTTVTWADANDYCTWVGKRLPTEAEWEKAARGPQSFEYPWGNKWDPKKINTLSDDPDVPYAPIGSYTGDKSVYGVYDMAANVAEWVADWYDTYPDAPPANIPNYGKVHRVVRGGMASSGHYDSISVVFRAARRTHLRPYTALIDLGFRCAKDIE
ncbi:MAG: SUMF1/EgtB/PvdO family nonheme iron enzyme [Gallionellaceae bacterium]|nr:SUMF1/EgtB/PvdO family nonheme iron enzyme [Gallionellaceae bacterium]